MMLVVLMCLLLYIHTAQREIYNLIYTVGSDAFLYCKHDGKVLWSKDRDGHRLDILTAGVNEDIQKYSPDLQNRYSVLSDLTLHIKNVSFSDSGIYYCNKTPVVNLTVTTLDEIKSNKSSNSKPGVTSAPPVNSTNTSQPISTQSNYTDPGFKTTQATPNSTLRSEKSSRPTTRTADTSPDCLNTTTSTRRSTTTEENKKRTYKQRTTTSGYGQPGVTSATPVSIKIAAAVSGGAVILLLTLVLLACIRRKGVSANRKENVYETVDDSYSTTQPVRQQNTNDGIYFLAGDPDIIKLGQRQNSDDHTYTLISESQDKDTEQGQDVPLYSTIVDTNNGKQL